MKERMAVSSYGREIRMVEWQYGVEIKVENGKKDRVYLYKEELEELVKWLKETRQVRTIRQFDGYFKEREILVILWQYGMIVEVTDADVRERAYLYTEEIEKVVQMSMEVRK